MKAAVYFVLYFSFCISLLTHAQPKTKKEDYARGTSSTTSRSRDRYVKDRYTNRFKSLPVIVKYSSKGLMYGNLCVKEVSVKMGFEYMISPEQNLSSDERISNGWNNFKTKTRMFFRHGPWWKLKFNHRLRKCRKLTMDHNIR